MVDHFIGKVWQAKKLKGKAKAMVVTRNIECAIRYFFAIREELKKANAPSNADSTLTRTPIPRTSGQ